MLHLFSSRFLGRRSFRGFGEAGSLVMREIWRARLGPDEDPRAYYMVEGTLGVVGSATGAIEVDLDDSYEFVNQIEDGVKEQIEADVKEERILFRFKKVGLEKPKFPVEVYARKGRHGIFSALNVNVNFNPEEVENVGMQLTNKGKERISWQSKIRGQALNLGGKKRDKITFEEPRKTRAWSEMVPDPLEFFPLTIGYDLKNSIAKPFTSIRYPHLHTMRCRVEQIIDYY